MNRVLLASCAFQITAGASAVPLFETGESERYNKISDGVLQLAASPATLNYLKDKSDGSRSIDIPTTSGLLKTYVMQAVRPFSAQTTIEATDGKNVTILPVPEVNQFVGYSVSDPSSTAFISITHSGQIWGFTREAKVGLTLFAPNELTGKSSFDHTLREASIEDLRTFWCASDAIHDGNQGSPGFSEPKATFKSTSTLIETPLLLDVSYSLFTQRFDSDTTVAAQYVANTIGAVSAIYQRDVNVALVIKKLVIWTSPDPFGVTSCEDQFEKYWAYNMAERSDEERAAAQLLGYAPGPGGMSYVGGLCNQRIGYSVCNLNGDAVFPVGNFHRDIYVVAHELGHQFGSVHTHCYSPPIDCCFNEPQGCNQCPDMKLEQDGSIMSYCHLWGAVNLYFHPRCAAVMRASAEQSACLSAYQPIPQPAITVSGNQLRIIDGDVLSSIHSDTDFGAVGVGTGSRTRSYAVRNDGQASLVITASLIIGSNPPNFKVKGTMPGTVGPGESVNLQVVFDPTSVGPHEATIELLSNDPNKPSFRFAVTGLGVTEGPNLSGWWAVPTLKRYQKDKLAQDSPAPTLLKTKFFVYNFGSQNTDIDSNLTVYVSDDNQLDSADILVGTFSTGIMKPQQQKKIKIAPKIPQNYAGRYLIGVLDSLGDINELNNNVVAIPIVG